MKKISIIIFVIFTQYIYSQVKDSVILAPEVSIKNISSKACVKKFKKTVLLKSLQVDDFSFKYHISMDTL